MKQKEHQAVFAVAEGQGIINTLNGMRTVIVMLEGAQPTERKTRAGTRTKAREKNDTHVGAADTHALTVKSRFQMLVAG